MENIKIIHIIKLTMIV